MLLVLFLTTSSESSAGGSQLDNLVCDITGGALGTIVSGPVNYTRNVILATPPDQRPPSMVQTWLALFREARQSTTPVRFLERRLLIGWGTVRVALGMGVGQNVYWRVRAVLGESSR